MTLILEKTLKTKYLHTIPCEQLKGIGNQFAKRLLQCGIYSIQDLLFHLPLRYQNRTRTHPLSMVKSGEDAVIEGEVYTVFIPKEGRTRLLCRLYDGTGFIFLRFFHMNRIQVSSWKSGTRIRCFGEIRRGNQGLEMIHPEYYFLSEETPLPLEQCLTPIYPSTDGITQRMWRKWIKQALEWLSKTESVQDILPDTLSQPFSFPRLKEALQFIHAPPIDAPLEVLLERKHPSQKRLVFEELLAHRLSLLHVKKRFQMHSAIPLPDQEKYLQQFQKNLCFELTSAQSRVIDEIHHDLAKPSPMLRLLQGDVGSGKTVVAAFALLRAIENECQAALLAPTELLSEQHYHTFQKWFEPLGIHVVLLSGQMKITARREALRAICEGNADVIIGTHAIFQKDIIFSRLALIIIDEQHRFGVQQRALLREKGIMDKDIYPHQLMMTATPIPRTLAMSVYADLDCSVIDTLPPGRTPVKTSVIPNTKRDAILSRIHEACQSGRQAYWVCPLIEESDVLACEAAEKTFLLLRTRFPNWTIGLLHGRMKSFEKEETMSSFKKGDILLLVATTVIEVGVDVPNASLMIIENAERLGLAQLHQLRGRVGRGSIESHCLLMYQSPLSQHAKTRLAVMRDTTDGFKIAECDLANRGAGEVLGTKQTGDVFFKIADLVRDSDLLPAIQEAANIIQQTYPDRIPWFIERWLGDGERFGCV